MGSSSTLTLTCLPNICPTISQSKNYIIIKNPTSFPHKVSSRSSNNKNNVIKFQSLLISCSSSSSSNFISCSRKPNWVRKQNEHDDKKIDFLVVNFYKFVFIKHPEDEVSKHLQFLEGRDIHGRIYINEQGINAQYSGPSEDALAYVSWLKEDEKFKDILVQISSPIHRHAFPRLKLRYKPSLVQLEGGVSHLPLVDSSMRATPITPAEWRKRVEAANNLDVSSSSNLNGDVILLDVRNGYEWDIGHFRGALRPNVDCFRSTTFGISGSEDIATDPLANVNKENTEILMYCTGGIRCDVYSTILRQRGYKKLYTLRGGISHYLESEGPVEWIGNLFVFDSRLSLPPSKINHDATSNGSIAHEVHDNVVFAKCYICGSQVSELRHRNCANLDCNLLHLCCSSCISDLKGCCSPNCTSAARIRPVLPGHERYKKWHHYRDT
uniref:rhodanese-like domain-containing protein 8, chloroplastic isoform X1 n=1 Tax=Erigeron canadensis TaxID=72917 RepID=UPI001CB9CD24|nr:rhodanese-like domain-containing protein 8, chloroplastic isoform X1 [Erigeron canadensis]